MGAGERRAKARALGPMPVAGGKRRRPRGELCLAQLRPQQRGAPEGVVLVSAQQLPGQDGELAGHRNRRHLAAAAGADTLAEGAQGPRERIAIQAASSRVERAWALPRLEIRPWRGFSSPDWRTLGSGPR
jgi:hypothetical protein